MRKEIRAPFLFYLINDLGFTREQCEKAWAKALKHFPSYDPEESGQLLTLEVATRDILRGDFEPKNAEVWIIEVEKVEKPKRPTFKRGDTITFKEDEPNGSK